LKVPAYALWKPSVFTLALLRSPIYWYTLLGLASVALFYLGIVYLLAGRSNEIAFRPFMSLDWRQAGLLPSLLSRQEEGYTALRLSLREVSPLGRAACLLIEAHQPNQRQQIAQRLDASDLAVDSSDLEAALRELSGRGVLQVGEDGYGFARPELGRVYQQVTTEVQRAALFERVRAENPVYVDTLHFFQQVGMRLQSEEGNTLTLAVENPALSAQLGAQVVVRILGDQSPRTAEIQSLAEITRRALGEPLRGKTAFVVVEQPPEAGARAQMYAYRWDEGFTVIPLSRARLRLALAENIAASELENILKDYLAKRPDLYDRSIPVRDENFFGRLQISEELLAYLDENQPVGIFALNKMGKTSLVRNLAERLTNRAVAVVDLQLEPDARSVYRTVVAGLERDLRAKWVPAEMPPLRLLAAYPSDGDLVEDFAHDMEVLHGVLSDCSPNPRFVIFIDEIDRLIPGEEGRSASLGESNSLLMALRGLSQGGLPLTFVGIGVQARINRQAQIAGVENAGFQMFHELFLPPMTRPECDQMINDIGQQMGLRYTEAALERIYAESGGHPFLARQLCSQAWDLLGEAQRGDRLITLDEARITAAVKAYLDDGRSSAYHQQTWEARLNEGERAIVKRLAEAGDPQAMKKGERLTMNALVERHLVLAEAGKYRLAFGLFERWVRLYILDIEDET